MGGEGGHETDWYIQEGGESEEAYLGLALAITSILFSCTPALARLGWSLCLRQG